MKRYGNDDAPELTAKIAKKLRPASEILPAELYQKLHKSTRTKKAARTLKLDSDIAAFFAKNGNGWEAEINNLLRQIVSLSHSAR